MLSDAAKEEIRAHMARYPHSRSALGCALYIAQEECGGWVPPEAVRDIAEVMGLEPADVQSTMSFYVMYNKAPVGKYLLEVCHNVSCHLLGAGKILEALRRETGIGPGETSEDGLFTIKCVECLAACGGAPCLQVNGIFHLNVRPEQVPPLIEKLRTEGGPSREMYNAVYAPERTPRAEKAGGQV